LPSTEIEEIEPTLRDLFAMQVLNGFLGGNAGMGSTAKDLAVEAYEFADAMLIARKKERPCLTAAESQ
jgi:hypothetical protein